MSDHDRDGENVGKVVEIRGVVIDAVFSERLPEIYTALRISVPQEDGQAPIDLIAEVQQHLGDDRVRAVAMDSTDGIPRGVEIVDTGGPISVPVGDATLGRIFNVLGEPIDRRDEDLSASSAGRSTATRPRSSSSLRRPSSWRPGSRSSICSLRTRRAARSASSAGRERVRPS